MVITTNGRRGSIGGSRLGILAATLSFMVGCASNQKDTRGITPWQYQEAHEGDPEVSSSSSGPRYFNPITRNQYDNE